MKRTVPLTVVLLFAGTILLPQGVGFHLPAGLPNLDLPRLAGLGLLLYFVLHILTTLRIRIRGAQRTLAMIVLLAAWQFVSATQSPSPRGSLIWAVGNLLSMWGVVFAFVSIAGGSARRADVVRALTIIGAVLAAWSVFELVTQSRLVPNRNLWIENGEYGRFSLYIRRVLPGLNLVLPYSSIGPYAANLTLASVLCALGGFLLVRGQKTVTAHNLCMALFTLGVLATQSRAGLLAAGIMLLLRLGLTGRRHERFVVAASVTVVAALVALTATEGFRTAVNVAYQEALKGTEARASFAGRWANLVFVFQQFQDRWFFGYGPGALADADRVVTNLMFTSDPGSLFAIVIESGVPAGAMLLALIGGSLWNAWGSRRDPQVQAAAIGLVGFLITAMSSATPWGWPVAFVLAGLIESWARQPLPVTAPDAYVLPRLDRSPATG